MKNLSIILILLFSFSSCKKNNDNNSPSKNTFTYTTNGQTYTVNEGKRITMYESTFIDAYINKSANYTSFNLAVEGEKYLVKLV